MDTNSYFTIETLQSGGVGLLKHQGSNSDLITLYYWVNTIPNTNRDNYTGIITSSRSSNVYISGLKAGDKIRFYRIETTSWRYSDSDYVRFVINSGNVSGNIASLFGYVSTPPAYACFNMFSGCGIVDASKLELPWTTLSEWCFGRMFLNCTKLTEPPYLPAETAVNSCYRLMFRQCTALKKISKMGCKHLAFASHYGMYQLCKGLEKVTLPLFDTYDNQALSFMFNGCSGLKELTVECPEVLSTKNMFYGLAGNCMNLERFTCLAKNSTANCTEKWLGANASYAAEHATFIKHPDATFWQTDSISGIPSGWTVKNMNPQTQTIDYSKITAAYSKGNHSLSAIYGRGGILLWGTPVNDYSSAVPL